jgi:hypothetical protein
MPDKVLDRVAIEEIHACRLPSRALDRRGRTAVRLTPRASQAPGGSIAPT